MLNILLVDDNPGDQKLFEEALKEQSIDCQLTIAGSANESIDKIFSRRPDLIVMDIKMSGIPGTEYVLLLQKNSATQFLPVIFLTGMKEAFSDSPDEINVGDKVYRLLRKPVDPQNLKQVIFTVLQKTED